MYTNEGMTSFSHKIAHRFELLFNIEIVSSERGKVCGSVLPKLSDKNNLGKKSSLGS